MEVDKKYSFDYLQKLLVYELDSCIHLEDWDHIKAVIQKIVKWTSDIQTTQSLLFQCTVDLLLNSPTLPLDILLDSLLVMTTEKLGMINHGSDREREELEVVGRWVRVVVGLSLPSREDVCARVLAQLKEFLKGQGKVRFFDGFKKVPS